MPTGFQSILIGTCSIILPWHHAMEMTLMKNQPCLMVVLYCLMGYGAFAAALPTKQRVMVEDDGTPKLWAYRRALVQFQP